MTITKMSERERRFIALHRASQVIKTKAHMEWHMDLPTADDAFGVQQEMVAVAAELAERAESIAPRERGEPMFVAICQRCHKIVDTRTPSKGYYQAKVEGQGGSRGVEVVIHYHASCFKDEQAQIERAVNVLMERGERERKEQRRKGGSDDGDDGEDYGDRDSAAHPDAGGPGFVRNE